MKPAGFRGMTIKVNRTSIKQIIITSVVGVISLFILISVLTSFGQGRGLSSENIHAWSVGLAGEHLLQVMGMENSHFTEPLPEGRKNIQAGSFCFSADYKFESRRSAKLFRKRTSWIHIL
ncbi:hypothetical protein [Alkalicoccobacillus plakortidis]|uniref:Uncharacterized protein n=1 Tax=Alkalicoccobacillus plakortidis TaxID=444060 RepID=A0ABT0XPN1_9BACI|nr:hypothetical protein [Alkalicoccobacillus plakortidis]MCM2677869.1 hypothetical protein [Alkalicoccobacillus plakortidis]